MKIISQLVPGQRVRLRNGIDMMGQKNVSGRVIHQTGDSVHFLTDDGRSATAMRWQLSVIRAARA